MAFCRVNLPKLTFIAVSFIFLLLNFELLEAARLWKTDHSLLDKFQRGSVEPFKPSPCSYSSKSGYSCPAAGSKNLAGKLSVAPPNSRGVAMENVGVGQLHLQILQKSPVGPPGTSQCSNSVPGKEPCPPPKKKN